jgi:hypothetical protein
MRGAFEKHLSDLVIDYLGQSSAKISYQSCALTNSARQVLTTLFCGPDGSGAVILMASETRLPLMLFVVRIL